MSECRHFWRAVDNRASQCSKCGEMRYTPCSNRECVANRNRIAELEAKLQAIRETRRQYYAGYITSGRDLCAAQEALLKEKGK